MWRDELQAFMIAVESPTLGTLFHRLHDENHPGLWYALLWGITRLTVDPVWMQVAQAAIATGTALLIYRASPFARAEKLLLLLSYFVFFEYFVLSRSYGLMALLGLAVVALRGRGARDGILPWLLLGLLANTVVYGTIWSVAMAVGLGAEQARRARRVAPLGPVLYAVLVVAAVVAMAPAGGHPLHGAPAEAAAARLASLIATPVDALLPLPLAWPRFWNPVPARGLVQALHLAAHPGVALATLAAAAAACCWIVGDRRLAAEFAIGYVGVLLFAYHWGFIGYARHHGVVWLMLIGAVWLARVRHPSRTRGRPLWWALLIVNAAGGLTTLSSELHPFSAGRDVARWIERHHLEDGLVLGSPASRVSTVAGYLGRPVYYLECECRRASIVYGADTGRALDAAELGRRVARALDRAGRPQALLVLNHELAPASRAAAPQLAFTLAHTFPDAVVPGERYVAYRVARSPASGERRLPGRQPPGGSAAAAGRR